MITSSDEEDYREFLSATDKAMSALMRVFDRAECSDDGHRMSMALRVQAHLHDCDRVMKELCSETLD